MYEYLILTCIFLYGASVTFTNLYTFFRLPLLYFYAKYHLWTKRRKPELDEEENAEFEVFTEEPMVTVQLPVFNEMYVVERLIDTITNFDWPRDKLEIQVLDDSTDDTLSISKKKVQEYKEKGFNIELLHRTDRTGYKAGALKEATAKATGRFIAIFDADFMPYPDFLRNTIPHFQDKNIGLVQTRWEHMNANHSIVTFLQAVHLNVHFTVEQKGRQEGGCLAQFNGTAGVWRKTTIIDGGNWHSDTLCEDLDLSFRMQIKGWKMLFLEDITSPSEIPADLNAFKVQQFRWIKGGAQACKKLLPAIWASDALTLRQKVMATEQLSGSFLFFFTFTLLVTSVPCLFLGTAYLDQISAFFSGLVIPPILLIGVYITGNTKAQIFKGRSILSQLIIAPFAWFFFLSMSMGLAFHNSYAALQGFLGVQSPFVRTPKQGEQSTVNAAYKVKISRTTQIEGLLCLYFACAFFAGLYYNMHQLLQLHCMAALGYGIMFFISLYQSVFA